VFAAGQGLVLGADYRLAHLPLVAPAHPACIASVPGRDYANGRYTQRRAALVLKIDADALEAAPSFRAVEAAMRAAPFGAKIAWDMGVRRRDVLHATLAASLDEAAIERCVKASEAYLAAHGELHVALGGPFVGNRNHGRLYLPVYPPKLGGADALGTLLAAAGLPYSGFYGIGLWHLADALDATEAAALCELLDAHWGHTLIEGLPVRLAILTVDNDLALPPVAWRWIDAPPR
jgi:hypothetical protein